MQTCNPLISVIYRHNITPDGWTCCLNKSINWKHFCREKIFPCIYHGTFFVLTDNVSVISPLLSFKMSNFFPRMLKESRLSIFILLRNLRFGGARLWRCPWCNRYRRRQWTQRLDFKSWTRLIAFHIALIPLGKVWIQLFALQLWVNSRAE